MGAALLGLAGCTAMAVGRDVLGTDTDGNGKVDASAPVAKEGRFEAPPDSSVSPPYAAPAPSAGPAAPSHARVDGRSFPEKVLALTWDDGPDANTLELGEYLKRRRISATFFVVRSWIQGLSDDPGSGKGVYESGYEFYPVLGDLVELGHRLGNHTLHHVVLRAAVGEKNIAGELRDNQRTLDALETNELRLFRVPGGGWGSTAAGVVDGDPYLSQLVGPIFWDVDRKDWDESLACEGARGAADCERAGPGGTLRMKANVLAERYAAAIENVGRGIVLLHDRVGHVGSTYAVDVAEALVPKLEARGYVFAAPLLHFSPLSLRLREGPRELDDPSRWDFDSIRIGDVNGDLREDLCGRTPSGISCAVSIQVRPSNAMTHTVFRHARVRARTEAPPSGVLRLADVTGDGQSDVCVRKSGEVDCAAADVVGALGPFRRWVSEPPPEGRAREARGIGFADIDGDGRADVCERSRRGIVCARSTGSKFDAPALWLDFERREEHETTAATTAFDDWRLADVDGDGRADVCGLDAGAVVCALSDGKGFGHLQEWSPPDDVVDGRGASVDLRFGDLNGDGRADVCSLRSAPLEGLSCALSNGRAFLRATLWLDASETKAQGWDTPENGATVQLGDVNGDGRADICGRGAGGIVCGLAP